MIDLKMEIKPLNNRSLLFLVMMINKLTIKAF